MGEPKMHRAGPGVFCLSCNQAAEGIVYEDAERSTSHVLPCGCENTGLRFDFCEVER